MKTIIVALVACALAACASLGVPQAKTFNEQLAAAVSADTAVLQSTQSLLAANKITAQDAQNIEQQADSVKAGIDIARTIHATDPNAGATRLQAAIAALTALQSYLTTKQQKAGS